VNVDEEPRFVFPEHFAKHHHFDLRLERDGVLKSLAVPKSLPEQSGERRLTIAIEDHAMEYLGFTGTITEGKYGAGDVKIRKTVMFIPLVWDEDRIKVILNGKEFTGKYNLIGFRISGENV
jgi:DNA ligase D-like protein (predicted 3'-phosphoesterase)